MAGPVRFRVLFGSGDDSRKFTIASGMPTSVDELALQIKTFFGVTEHFRLQYQDADFGNEFMNLSSISDIQDHSTLKVVYLPCEATSSIIISATLTDDIPTIQVTPSDASTSSSYEPNESESAESSCSNETTLLPSLESRSCTWPAAFVFPRFSYCAEMQLQKGNDEFKVNGTLISLSPKLRSDILEGLAEEIITYTAYPKDDQFEQVAKALITTHPCLQEKGTRTGFCGWKHYIKIKMMNFRTKLGRAGHPEVTVNSLKHKQKGQGKPAANIKKPRRAEVNFCPNHPRGETTDSLEVERVALLAEVQKRNNETDQGKDASYFLIPMTRNSSGAIDCRGQKQMASPVSNGRSEFGVHAYNNHSSNLKIYWTTGQIHRRLVEVFRQKGGCAGQKIHSEMANTRFEIENIHFKRDCILRCLSIYLNEDMERLIKEYVDIEGQDAVAGISQTTMGIYVIRPEGAEPRDKPVDVGVVLEGLDVLQNLPSVTLGCVMLFGLIYALNLNYPKDLKCTFEAFQKILMELDTSRLSPKVQALKMKLLQ